ncbi:unnamed protein product [Ceutorhynchus assimilis]|uniref:N-acetyltransferase domain-containing protein n=1 Tax=Ceutorhynchus assimilis TaxID=467358 RepID=A0A9N9QLH9_9CUCU|nr:unnamed protein product [Ceutorhynchus assimilis]
MKDILVELSDADMEKLAKIYENHKTELPHLYSFFCNCLKAKKIGMTDFVRFYTLDDDSWQVDGTFIASMPNHGHDIVLHSLDPTGKNLMEALTKTNRFKYLQDPARNFTLFYAVHENFYPKIRQLLAQQKHKLQEDKIFDETLSLWVLEKEKAPKIPSDNQDVYVKQLQPQDFSIINEKWKFRYPESEQKFLDCFKLSPGSGVYLKSNNQLVSWVVSSCLGQMTALQTLKQHKKKGYGSLAVKHMANNLAEGGFDCCGTVHLGNAASEGLMTKLGFKKLFKCQYIPVDNKY